MGYAEGTSVTIEKTKAEIETLLRKRGCEKFGSLEDGPRAIVMFEFKGKAIRFTMPLPRRDEKRFTQAPRQTWKPRPAEAAYRAWEQACREKWRALLLGIRAKFSNVDAGIATFEQEFMGKIVMPDGKTVEEHVLPRIEQAYLSGKAMPLMPASTEAGP
jgi:hypothetical protein